MNPQIPKTRRTWTVILGIMASCLAIAPTAVRANVNVDGTFSQSIPIVVPPGTNGVAPKLALEYNSQAGNGIVGMGWTLSGLPIITRINTGNGISYSGTDSFAGPDGRLNDPKGSPFSYARHQRWSKYVPSGTCGDGPCWWSVYNSDGSKMVFGYTSDSRIGAAGKGGAVRVWALNSYEDANGNYWDVQYAQDNGAYYPTLIRYTLGNGLVAYRTIRFDYESGDRPDYVSDNAGGINVQIRKRLDAIRVEDGTGLIRKYALAYEIGSATGRSRLTSVEEFGNNSSSLVKQTFTWQDGGAGLTLASQSTLVGSGYSADNWQLARADVNGDGRTDILALYLNSPGDGVRARVFLSNGDGTFADKGEKVLASSGYNRTNWKLVTADIDGDGRMDIQALYLNTPGDGIIVQTFLSSGDGNFKNMGIKVLAAAGYSGANWQLVPADIDGDGRNDIAALYLNSPGDGIIVRTFLSSGDGSFIDKGETVLAASGYNRTNWKLVTADIDGDGKMDIQALYLNTPGDGIIVRTFLSKGDGLFTDKGEKVLVSSGYSGANWKLQCVDLNNDGKADILALYTNTPGDGIRQRSFISKGDGTFEDKSETVLAATGYSGVNWTLSPTDVNGDGYVDIVGTYLNSPGDGVIAVTFISNRDGTFTPQTQTTLASSGYNASNWAFVPADIRGSGRNDLLGLYIQPAGGDGIIAQTVLVPGPTPDLLGHIYNGLGVTTIVAYTPATQVANAVQPDTTTCGGGSAAGYGKPCGIADASPRPLVTAVSVNDGHGAAYITTYSYSNGRFYPGIISDQADLGFQIFTAQGPAGNTVTSFLQTGAFAGTAAQILETTPSGASKSLVQNTSQVYGGCAGGGCTAGISDFPRLVVTSSSTSSMINPSTSGTLTSTVTASSFDSYGNPTSATITYNNGLGSPLETNYAYTSYVNNAAANVFGLAYETKLCGDSACLVTIKHERTYFDNNGLGSIGTRLLPTQVETIAGGITATTTNSFDAFGNVIQTVYPNGTTTGAAWDSTFAAMKVSATDATGGVATVTGTDMRYGIATDVTDSNGIRTTTALDAFGRPTEIKVLDPSGTVIQRSTAAYVVSSSGVDKTECRYVASTSYCSTTYADGLGRVYKTTMQGEGGTLTSLTEFDAAGRVYRTSQPAYGSTPAFWNRQTRDSAGRVTELALTDASGSVISHTSTVYDDASPASGAVQVITTTNPDGNVTRVNLDHKGRKVQITEGVGSAIPATTTFVYNAQNMATSTTDAMGRVTTATYDGAGRVVSQTVPGVGTITRTYNNSSGQGAFGQIASIVAPDPNGTSSNVTKTFSYDVYGRKTGVSSTDGTTVAFTYGTSAPNRGLVVQTTSISDGFTLTKQAGRSFSSGNTTATLVVNLNQGANSVYSYTVDKTTDALGRTVASTLPDASRVHWAYTTGSGKPQSVTLDGVTTPIASYSYDSADPKGAVSQVALANGVTTDYLYQAGTGVLSNVKTKLGSTIYLDSSYQFSAGGQLAILTNNIADLSGLSATYSYDALGRLTNVIRSTSSFAYAFDLGGSMTSKEGTSRAVDSGTGRLISVPGGDSVTWGAGAIVSRTNATKGITVGYAWDDSARLKAVSINGTEQEHNYYDETGRRFLKVYNKNSATVYKTFYMEGGYEIREKWNNGTRDDNASHATRYIVGANGQNLASFTTAGQTLMAFNNSVFSKTQYALAGLLPFMKPGSFIGKIRHYLRGYFAQEFAVQALTVYAFFAAVTALFLYMQISVWKPALLRMLANSGLYHGHIDDAESFTGRNPVLAGFAPVLLFAFVNLVQCGGSRETEQNGIFYMQNGLSRVDRNAIIEGDTSMGLPIGSYFYLGDYIGSTGLVLDSAGGVVNRINYKPYGQIDQANSGLLCGTDIAASGTCASGTMGNASDAVTFKFTGQEYDPEGGPAASNGLHNYNARYYDTDLGIFISADSVHGGGISQGFNRWMYVGGNPVNYVDPSGHNAIVAMFNDWLAAVAKAAAGGAHWAAAGAKGGLEWAAKNAHQDVRVSSQLLHPGFLKAGRDIDHVGRWAGRGVDHSVKRVFDQDELENMYDGIIGGIKWAGTSMGNGVKWAARNGDHTWRFMGHNVDQGARRIGETAMEALGKRHGDASVQFDAKLAKDIGSVIFDAFADNVPMLAVDVSFTLVDLARVGPNKISPFGVIGLGLALDVLHPLEETPADHTVAVVEWSFFIVYGIREHAIRDPYVRGISTAGFTWGA